LGLMGSCVCRFAWGGSSAWGGSTAHEQRMYMTMAPEQEGESAKEKLLREMLVAQKEAGKQTLEALQKALEAKDEALEAKDETLQKALEAKDKTLQKALEAKDETLREKERLIAERDNQIVVLRGKGEAVVANRYIVETTAAHFEYAAGRNASSSHKGSKNFAFEHLLAKNGTKLTNDAKQTYDELVKRTKGRFDERSVCNELNDIYHEVSNDVHYPEWMKENLRSGIYAGSEGGPLGLALGVWVAKAQELQYIKYPVMLVHNRNIVAKIERGRVLDPNPEMT